MSAFSRRRRSHSPSADIQASARPSFRRRRSPSPITNAQNVRPRPSTAVNLPFQAKLLKKGDLEAYKSMFGLYLDIQKQIVLDELDEKELRGRWKSFVGKW